MRFPTIAARPPPLTETPAWLLERLFSDTTTPGRVSFAYQTWIATSAWLRLFRATVRLLVNSKDRSQANPVTVEFSTRPFETWRLVDVHIPDDETRVGVANEDRFRRIDVRNLPSRYEVRIVGCAVTPDDTVYGREIRVAPDEDRTMGSVRDRHSRRRQTPGRSHRRECEQPGDRQD